MSETKAEHDSQPQLDLDAIEKAARNGADAGWAFTADCLALVAALRAARQRNDVLEAALRLADRALHVPPFAYTIDRVGTLKLRQQARHAVNAALLAAGTDPP